MNAQIDFDVLHKDAEGRIPESKKALRCEKLAYSKLELPLDRPVLTSACKSDVSTAVEKDNLWDWNRCACHYVNIAVQSALRCSCIQKFAEPLVELAHKFSKSRSLWTEFKKV